MAYSKYDILIPQQNVLSSSYMSTDYTGKKTIINFDTLILSCVADDIPDAKNKTQIELKGKEQIILQTSIIPELISADLSEFKNFGGELGETLLTKGFISVRFQDDKIQYLADIGTIVSRGATK